MGSLLMAEARTMGYAAVSLEPAGVGNGSRAALTGRYRSDVALVKLSTGDSAASIDRIPDVSPGLQYDRHEVVVHAEVELLEIVDDTKQYRPLRPALYEAVAPTGQVHWRVVWDDPHEGQRTWELACSPHMHTYHQEIGNVQGPSSFTLLPFLRDLEERLLQSASRLPSSLDAVADKRGE